MKTIAATLIATAGAARIHSGTVVKHNFTEADYHYEGDGSPFEAWAATLDTPDCPSRVRRSRCSNDRFRGVVAFFHGYSACAEQVESVSEMLANNCVDVVAPTMPGHGNAAVWCGTGGASCDVQTGNGMGWTHDNLPTHRSAYDEFARAAHRAIRQEVNYRAGQTGKPADGLEVSLIGLSFGAPMALDLALMGGTYYARQLLVNPYLALGDETIDQAKMECELLIPSGEKTHEQCEQEAVTAWLAPAGLPADSPIASWLGDDAGEVTRSLFTNLVKLSDAVGDDYQGRQEGEPEGTIAGLMEGEQEWGAVCNQIWTQGRGGFCKFKKKHLLSTHSFSLHAVVDAQQWGAWSWGVPNTQIMTTERDGKTRNGLAYDLAQHLHSVDPNAVHMCMHKFQHGTDRSNPAQYWDDANSMPHANLKGTRQAGRWWEPHLFDNVRKFIVGGDSTINEAVRPRKDRNVCETVAVESGAERRQEVLDLVDVGVAPTRNSELWPGLLYNALSIASR